MIERRYRSHVRTIRCCPRPSSKTRMIFIGAPPPPLDRCYRSKIASESSVGRGEGRQALGWVVKSGTDPPRLPSAATPPEKGILKSH